MKRCWLPLVSLLVLLRCGHAMAQSADNLVYNPSFEEYSDCPQRVDALGIMSGVDAWWQPTKGSSDYFNACGARECQVPRNKMGIQQPHSGQAYCGIYCSQENYREYLQTELKEPLKQGRRYRVCFWASLAEKSPHAIASLGALFTEERITDTTWNILMHSETSGIGDGHNQIIATYFKPQVNNPSGRVLIFMDQWNKVSGEFVAAGGERYLTIGNFLPFNRSSVVSTHTQNAVLNGAYYYIDDVSVVCVDCEEPEPQDTATVQPGMVITLKGVYFDTDKSDILPQSYKELNELLHMLLEHPTMKVELCGHTDNRGTVGYNQRLSEARAKAVVDYLTEHGISLDRLSYVGFGQSKPVDDNTTELGRANNRRVECHILEM